MLAEGAEVTVCCHSDVEPEKYETASSLLCSRYFRDIMPSSRDKTSIGNHLAFFSGVNWYLSQLISSAHWDIIPWGIASTEIQNPTAHELPSIFAWMMYQEKRSYEKNQSTHVCGRRNNSDELFALHGAEFKGDFYHAVRLLRRGRETASRNLHSETAGG